MITAPITKRASLTGHPLAAEGFDGNHQPVDPRECTDSSSLSGCFHPLLPEKASRILKAPDKANGNLVRMAQENTE